MQRKEWAYILGNGTIQEKVYCGEGHIEIDLLMANPEIKMIILPCNNLRAQINNICLHVLENDGYQINKIKDGDEHASS